MTGFLTGPFALHCSSYPRPLDPDHRPRSGRGFPWDGCPLRRVPSRPCGPRGKLRADVVLSDGVVLPPMLASVFRMAMVAPSPISIMMTTAATPMTVPRVVSRVRVTLRRSALAAVFRILCNSGW